MGALVREGMIDPGGLPGEHHAFGRIEPRPAELDGVDPAALLVRLAGAHPGADAVAQELTDAAVNLAVALARRERDGAPPTDLFTDPALDPDERSAAFERLAIEGHNLHPCARTRLGWSVPDLLAYDLEAAGVEVGFVGVRREVHIGDDLGALLEPGWEHVGLDLDAYAVTPVHGWLAGRIAAGRYADLVATGLLVPLTGQIAATPTAALRTLLLPRDVTGPRYLKLSLDIQVTSTRRTISIASTRNGPVLSRLLERLLAEGPGGDRVLLMAETAGAATRLPGGRDRELSAIARTGLTGRLEPGELAVPGAALYAPAPSTGQPVVAALVDRYAAARALADRPAAALGFLDEYAAAAAAAGAGAGRAARHRARGPPAELRADLRRRCAAPAGRAGPGRPAGVPAAAGSAAHAVAGVGDHRGRRRHHAGQGGLHGPAGPPRRAGGAAGRVARPGRAGRLGPGARSGSTASTTGCGPTPPPRLGPRTTRPF